MSRIELAMDWSVKAVFGWRNSRRISNVSSMTILPVGFSIVRSRGDMVGRNGLSNCVGESTKAGEVDSLISKTIKKISGYQ